MLEHFPSKSHASPSKRLNAITTFLEEAVKVVPIESILYAIGYDEIDTAVKCAKALIKTDMIIPGSNEARKVMQTAIVRMRTGLHGTELDAALTNIFKHHFLFEDSHCLVIVEAISQDEIHIKIPLPIMPAKPYYSSILKRGIIVQRSQVQEGRRAIVYRINLSKHDRPMRTYPHIANRLERMMKKFVFTESIICNLSIEHIYPIHSIRRHSLWIPTLQSPIEVLRSARDEITKLMINDNEDVDSSSQFSNEQMLTLVKQISDNNLKICASLIGSFMENQIKIPFLKSEEGTASKLSEAFSPVAMGVWALFSMSFDKLREMLSGMDGNPLFVEIADYISLISSNDQKRSSKYAGKLQFLLQGMIDKTVTCSSKYISYSLEHQLRNNLKFEKDITIKTLVKDWDKIFKGDALSLIAKSHRSLVARWLKWVVLVHDLRETLAKYTCVGITGLINSGKSCLVSQLFDLEVSILAIAKEPMILVRTIRVSNLNLHI